MSRWLTVSIAALALTVLLPVIAVVSVLIRVTMGGPVLFRQERTGQGGAPFELLKFRTMLDARDARGELLSDDERTTRLGALLRKTSLDELPGLINVVLGDMNLVGPRPVLHDYYELFNTDQLRRFDVRGGVTGWAQVNGRNGLTWEDKFELDTWYVDNRSLLLDLKILLMTVGVVVSGSGVSASETITMERFQGTKASQESNPT